MNRPRRSAIGGVAVGLALLAVSLDAAAAVAAEPERKGKVGLVVNGCSESFESSLRRILVIELGDLLDDARSEVAEGLESLEIACEAETARISAHGAAGDQVVQNDLRFDAFPGDAAPRAVALAALEALRAVDPTLTERIEAQRTKARASVPPPAKVSEPAKPPAPPSVVRRAFTRVLIGGGARFFLGQPGATTAGARLELSRRFRGPWDAGVDLDGSFSRRRLELGTIEARLLSTAAWFGARLGENAWSATAALGGRLGLVESAGVPSSGVVAQQATRFFGGPILVIRGDGAVSSAALAFVIESGFAAAGAQGLAGGTPAIGFDGFWIAVSASAGLRF